jgi:hypothetical protein
MMHTEQQAPTIAVGYDESDEARAAIAVAAKRAGPDVARRAQAVA